MLTRIVAFILAAAAVCAGMGWFTQQSLTHCLVLVAAAVAAFVASTFPSAP